MSAQLKIYAFGSSLGRLRWRKAKGSCFALLRRSLLVASQVLLTALQPWNASRHSSQGAEQQFKYGYPLCAPLLQEMTHYVVRQRAVLLSPLGQGSWPAPSRSCLELQTCLRRSSFIMYRKAQQAEDCFKADEWC